MATVMRCTELLSQEIFSNLNFILKAFLYNFKSALKGFLKSFTLSLNYVGNTKCRPLNTSLWSMNVTHKPAMKSGKLFFFSINWTLWYKNHEIFSLFSKILNRKTNKECILLLKIKGLVMWIRQWPSIQKKIQRMCWITILWMYSIILING